MSFNSSGSGPTLSLGIAHNYGAIWDLSWCPSGTWEPKLSTKKQVWYRYIIVSQCLNSNIRCVKMFQWNIRISCVVTIWPKVCKDAKSPLPVDVRRPKTALLEEEEQFDRSKYREYSSRFVCCCFVITEQLICLNSLVSNIKFPGYFLSSNSIMNWNGLAAIQMLCFALLFRMEPSPV